MTDEARDFYIAGRPLRLSGRPLDLLAALYVHEGTTVSRTDLAQIVWGKEVSDWAIDQALSRLRVVIREAAGDLPDVIEPVKGPGQERGLKLRANVVKPNAGPHRRVTDLSAFWSFWRFSATKPVHLVCPEIPESERLPYASFRARDYLRLAKFADIDTLYHLKSFLAGRFPALTCQECTSEELPTSSNSDNLMIIGGPAWNKITGDLIERISLPWVFLDGGPGNDDPLQDTREVDLLLRPVTGHDGSIYDDVGLFVCVPNPANPECTVHIVAGVRTYGVLGAAKCFTADDGGPENCAWVLNKTGPDPWFAAVMRVPVINGFVGVPRLDHPGTVHDFLTYSPITNTFTSI